MSDGISFGLDLRNIAQLEKAPRTFSGPAQVYVPRVCGTGGRKDWGDENKQIEALNTLICYTEERSEVNIHLIQEEVADSCVSLMELSLTRDISVTL